MAEIVKKKKRRPVEDKPVLTLSEALNMDDNAQLFVVNASSKLSDTGSRSDILIDIIQSNGSPTLLAIPDSWLPIDVTSVVSRWDALNSPIFRKAVANGMIKIVSTKEAERILESEDVHDERRRLTLRETEETVTTDETIDESSSIADVSPAVVELMNRPLPPRDRLAALKNMDATLTHKDVHYIMVKAGRGESKLLGWLEGRK